MSWLRRRYGAGPLQLLSLLSCFALAGYVVTRVLAGPEGLRILVWFAGAAIAHDLFLWPLYALADMTAFDPAAHRESVEAHRGLLERHPGRRSSWRSLERIASHWKRERAQKTCVAVLQALGPAGGASPIDGAPLVEVGAPTDPTVAAASSDRRDRG